METTFGWNGKQRSLLAEKNREKGSDGVERKDKIKEVIKENKTVSSSGNSSSIVQLG